MNTKHSIIIACLGLCLGAAEPAKDASAGQINSGPIGVGFGTLDITAATSREARTLAVHALSEPFYHRIKLAEWLQVEVPKHPQRPNQSVIFVGDNFTPEKTTITVSAEVEPVITRNADGTSVIAFAPAAPRRLQP